MSPSRTDRRAGLYVVRPGRTNPAVEEDAAELEERLVGDLQTVLAALKRSSYAPPPGLGGRFGPANDDLPPPPISAGLPLYPLRDTTASRIRRLAAWSVSGIAVIAALAVIPWWRGDWQPPIPGPEAPPVAADIVGASPEPAAAQAPVAGPPTVMATAEPQAAPPSAPESPAAVADLAPAEPPPAPPRIEPSRTAAVAPPPRAAMVPVTGWPAALRAAPPPPVPLPPPALASLAPPVPAVAAPPRAAFIPQARGGDRMVAVAAAVPPPPTAPVPAPSAPAPVPTRSAAAIAAGGSVAAMAEEDVFALGEASPAPAVLPSLSVPVNPPDGDVSGLSAHDPSASSPETPPLATAALGKPPAGPEAAPDRPLPPASEAEPDPSPADQVDTRRIRLDVNMRAGPDNSHRVVGVIPAGRRFEVIACEIWCEVAYAGKRGWVFKGLIEGKPPAARRRAPDRKPPAPVARADKPEACAKGFAATALALMREGFRGGAPAKAESACD